MKYDDLFKHLESLIGFVGFDYHGKKCGIDPLSLTQYEMWCGDEYLTAQSIEDVKSADIFDGENLKSIWSKVKNIDY